TLTTCGDDQTVRLWAVPGPGPHNAPPPASPRGPAPRFAPPPGPTGGAPPPAPRVVTTLKDPHPHDSGISYVAFSPNGKKLATANEATTAVTLWDLSRRKEIATLLRGHKKSVCSVAFSPDGETLATASLDGTVKLWSADPKGQGTTPGWLTS